MAAAKECVVYALDISMKAHLGAAKELVEELVSAQARGDAL